MTTEHSALRRSWPASLKTWNLYPTPPMTDKLTMQANLFTLLSANFLIGITLHFLYSRFQRAYFTSQVKSLNSLCCWLLLLLWPLEWCSLHRWCWTNTQWKGEVYSGSLWGFFLWVAFSTTWNKKVEEQQIKMRICFLDERTSLPGNQKQTKLKSPWQSCLWVSLCGTDPIWGLHRACWEGDTNKAEPT